MAAYAALVSVMQIIDQIQLHPRPPISLDRKQAESLTKSISFLQEFLEGYNPRVSYSTDVDLLESRIAEAAYAAEDVIESYIVDQIHAQSQNHVYPKKLDLFVNQRARLDLFLDSVLDQFHAQSQNHVYPEEEVELLENVKRYIQDQFHAQSQNHGYPSAEELFEYLSRCIQDQDQFDAQSQNHDYLNEEDFLENLRAYMQVDRENITCIQIFQCVPTLISYIAHKIQGFLDGQNPPVCHGTETNLSESRMAEAADVIESYVHAAAEVVKSYIHAPSIDHGKNMNSVEFCRSLQKVIEEMDLIKMEVVELKEKMMQIKKFVTGASSIQSSSTAQKVTMVGFDDVLYEMLDKITGGGRDRQIIPIVGMGGIGKTTLAQNIYVNSFVKQHFDVCAWSTIAQEHNIWKILSEILDQVDKEEREDLSEYELGEKLYKYLIGRRYLIVMDDMWDIEAWEGVARFFPDNGNGSRIVITTRLSNLASQFNCSNGLHMKFLNQDSSWNLISKTVFGEEICPPELEDVGKKIVKGCKGLPLSIVVIGGLLSKSRRTRENWESIYGNLISIVNSEDNESCLQLLYTSYNNLPVYMKPCFLYMGLYSEDYEIKIFLLISLWVAEGFIKPIDGKSLEEVGEEYLEELVDRNLILVHKRNLRGGLYSIKIHDLLRDLCLREAQKEKFLCVLGEKSIHEIPPGITISQRRIASVSSTYPSTPLLQSLESASPQVRSLIGKLPRTLSSKCRLLRVSYLDIETKEESRTYYEKVFLRLANLRHLSIGVDERILPRIPPSVSFLWNLQTLILSFSDGGDYIFEIWRMPLLRHVMTDRGSLNGTYCFPTSCDPSPGGGDHMVLENLQTIPSLTSLNFSERIPKTIPNIKRLVLNYNGSSPLENICFLHKLEVLSLCSYSPLHTLPLPSSLKELTLRDTKLPWKDMKTNIGSLPLLEVLNLRDNSFTGPEWETVEGQFCSLKYLEICHCINLKYWKTDNTHFPRLERLILSYLPWLREVPSSIGDIPTLRSIELLYCSVSADGSARCILEEQEECGNEGLQLRVDIVIR